MILPGSNGSRHNPDQESEHAGDPHSLQEIYPYRGRHAHGVPMPRRNRVLYRVQGKKFRLPVHIAAVHDVFQQASPAPRHLPVAGFLQLQDRFLQPEVCISALRIDPSIKWINL